MYFAISSLSPLGKGRVLYLNKPESPSTKDDLCQGWLKLAQEFWRIRQFVQFRIYLPFEKWGALHLKKFESPSPKDNLYQGWLKLVQWLLKKRFFKFVNFCYFVISPLGKGRGPSFEKLESPSPKNAVTAKVGWNWPSGSGGEDVHVNVKSLRRQQWQWRQRQRTTDIIC